MVVGWVASLGCIADSSRARMPEPVNDTIASTFFGFISILVLDIDWELRVALAANNSSLTDVYALVCDCM